ncbi:MAG: SMP-30/gluconolactonase/LRE family protein [Verrucomicrobia bacterium]|nr:SMP-30/gluconolactonase/LRE family protein [Verrucomicrobiota bacterium]MBI3870552.1 SMP-30/gluconolactonase/LRE family protein [Verrucomicrobiota bacterium]
MRTIHALAIACFGFTLSLPAAENSVLAPGAKLERISSEFQFTEGPAVDRRGNLYFTDQPNDRIMRLGTDGALTTFLKPAGRSNGTYFDRDGNLIACADEKNELWSIAPDGKVTVLLKEHQGKLLNGPNDLWVRPDNALYFTDPFYKRPYWHRGGGEQGGEHVYFMTADRKTVTRVADDLKQPNGIIGAPTGKTLYVSDIGAGKTYSYAVHPDGHLTDKKLFCELGSDGMTIDNRGNVYLTGKGVFIVSPAGKTIEHIDVPEPWTANVAFAGKDRSTLFITASKSLYRIKTVVRGRTK